MTRTATEQRHHRTYSGHGRITKSGDGFQPRNLSQWQRDRMGRVQPITLPRRGLLATIFRRNA